MTKKLLPCPFCGEDCAEIRKDRDQFAGGRTTYFVECRHCGCRTYEFYFVNIAIAAWNRRAEVESDGE